PSFGGFPSGGRSASEIDGRIEVFRAGDRLHRDNDLILGAGVVEGGPRRAPGGHQSEERVARRHRSAVRGDDLGHAPERSRPGDDLAVRGHDRDVWKEGQVRYVRAQPNLAVDVLIGADLDGPGEWSREHRPRLAAGDADIAVTAEPEGGDRERRSRRAG